MGYPPRNRRCVSTSYPLGGSDSSGSQPAFVQATQAMLSFGLCSHMDQELLKGEQMADQTFDGQRLKPLLLVEDVQTVRLGIQLQAQAMADQLARDVILLEIDLDHAMGIDFALHMPAIKRIQPAIRIDDLGQGAQGRQGGKGGARRLVATGKRLVGSLEIVVLPKVLSD